MATLAARSPIAAHSPAAATRTHSAAGTAGTATMPPAVKVHRLAAAPAVVAPRRIDQSAPEIPASWRRFKAVFELHALRPGVQPTSDGPWKVTAATLSGILAGFQATRRAGRRIALTWDHSDSSRDETGEILAVRLGRDGWLRPVVGTNSDKAIEFLEGGGQVSPCVEEPFCVGTQRIAPIALTHVALCQHPIVAGQPPARRLLSRAQRTKRLHRRKRSMSEDIKRRKLADDAAAAAGGETGGGGATEPADDATDAPVAWFVKLLNDDFEAGISSEVDTVKELRIAMDMLRASWNGEEEAEAETTETAVDPNATAAVVDPAAGAAATDPATMAMSRGGGGKPAAGKRRALSAAETENQRLRRELADVRTRELSRAKVAYEAELDHLAETGRITADDRAALMTEGQATGFVVGRAIKQLSRLPEGFAVPVKRMASGVVKPATEGNAADRAAMAAASRQRLLAGMGLGG